MCVYVKRIIKKNIPQLSDLNRKQKINSFNALQVEDFLGKNLKKICRKNNLTTYLNSIAKFACIMKVLSRKFKFISK